MLSEMKLPDGFKGGRFFEWCCDMCHLPKGAICVQPMLVSDPEKPQNQVLAIVMLASKRPPMIVKSITNQGVEQLVEVPNPDHDPMDRVMVAMWTRRIDLCSDKACFDEAMDKFWRQGQKKLRMLWKQNKENRAPDPEASRQEERKIGPEDGHNPPPG